jgi:hypothetical protein
MVASLTVFAQYPTTKKIKGTQVVIMTVPQAEQIDNQFTLLNDSITKLNKKIGWKVHEVKVADNQRQKTFDSLQIFRVNLLTANTTIDSLTNQMRRIEKLEFIEKRTRTRLGFGIVGSVVAWITFAILVIKS